MNEQTSDLAMATAIASFIMPVLISIVQQPRWQPRTRVAVATVLSLLGGAATVYFTTPTLFDDGTAMTTVMLTVLVASTSVYNHLYKPAGIRKLEDATAPGDDTLAIESALEEELTLMLEGGTGESYEVDVHTTTPDASTEVAGGNMLDRAPVVPAPHSAGGTIVPNGPDEPVT